MGGVGTTLLTVEQVVYQDAQLPLLQTRQLLDQTVVAAKISEVQRAIRKGRMVDAVRHMDIVGKRQTSSYRLPIEWCSSDKK